MLLPLIGFGGFIPRFSKYLFSHWPPTSDLRFPISAFGWPTFGISIFHRLIRLNPPTSGHTNFGSWRILHLWPLFRNEPKPSSPENQQLQRLSQFSRLPAAQNEPILRCQPFNFLACTCAAALWLNALCSLRSLWLNCFAFRPGHPAKSKQIQVNPTLRNFPKCLSQLSGLPVAQSEPKSLWLIVVFGLRPPSSLLRQARSDEVPNP